MLTAAWRRSGGGAGTKGAPRPSDGKGVRPLSTGAGGADSGSEAGAAGAGVAACAAGTGAAGRKSLWALRLPNTLLHSGQSVTAALAGALEQLAEQARAAALGFGAAGEDLRHLAEQVRRLMAGRHLGDHLAVIGGGAEQLRLG